MCRLVVRARVAPGATRAWRARSSEVALVDTKFLARSLTGAVTRRRARESHGQDALRSRDRFFALRSARSIRASVAGIQRGRFLYLCGRRFLHRSLFSTGEESADSCIIVATLSERRRRYIMISDGRRPPIE